ncbi:universal stress protein [Lactococcus fujiensis]|uniref:Universal stress protein n=1 Tax=Lactococcus fujiensis JCM 16395 TaxID=1291764 RepID=A0A2A5RJ21_9LACT|nr:universal stress protein [Lactococcus fujiensis]PCR99070.1 Universal stress protein family [Lactococcus fujiensis JCM 16395]
MKEVYNKILVAVDGSKQSENAVQEAVAIAKRNQTSLFVLHVKDETQLSGTPYAMPLNLEVLENNAQQILDNVKKIINGEVPYEIYDYTGLPKKQIVEFAEEFGIDLIVIGSNGKNLLDRILLGSTSTYVVSHAPCNVMVVK